MDLIDREQAIEIAIDIACNLDRDWEYEQIASAMDNAFEKARQAYGTGAYEKGEIRKLPAMREAYEAGLNA